MYIDTLNLNVTPSWSPWAITIPQLFRWSSKQSAACSTQRINRLFYGVDAVCKLDQWDVRTKGQFQQFSIDYTHNCLPFIGKQTSLCNSPGSRVMTEFIALVDEQDNVVGREEKYACHRRTILSEYGKLHRAFSLFIFDPQQPNKMLLQKRSAEKHTFPLQWSNSVCSHPSYPEETLDCDAVEGVNKAAARRAKYELGLTILPEQMTVVGRILYQAKANETYSEWELDYLVFCRHDGTPEDSFNQSEVQEVSWKDINELQVDNPTPWFHRLCQSGILNRLWNDYINKPHNHFDMTIMQL